MAVLKKVQQFAEDFREVSTVHLIDDEDSPIINGLHRSDQIENYPVDAFELNGSGTNHRSQSLYELLVCISRFKLNNLHSFSAISGEVLSVCFGNHRLARS